MPFNLSFVRIIGCALIIAVGLPACSWLETRHRGWIYRPTPGLPTDWVPITPHDQLDFIDQDSVGQTGRHRLRILYVPAPDARAPVVLYLHGTFRNIFQNRSKIAAIHEAGLAVFAVEYRGWGDSSTIVPNEQSIVADAERAFEAFSQKMPDPGNRIIFGHSMGAAVAVDLASRRRQGRDYGALVLESAFKSLPDIARDYSLTARLLASFTTQRFESIAKIGAIDGPGWFLTGRLDKTIPSAHTDALYRAAREPRYRVAFDEGGHSRLHVQYPRRYRALWQCIAASLAAPQDAIEALACVSALPDEQAAPDR